MTIEHRRHLLAAAGNNVLNLSGGDVPLNYFSDVPDRVVVPAVAAAAAAAVTADSAIDLAAEYGTLCPGTKLTFFTKGRAAEVALVDALGLTAPRIVTHGLFATTQQALARCNAKIEVVATAAAAGTSDVDLDAVRARMSDGKVDAVYLEPANNGLGGWPLGEDNVAAVRELCDRHGAKLLLDATRSITNAATFGTDIFARVERMLAMADAFTISCGKEYLFPFGALLGSRDEELVGRAAMSAFRTGTTLSSFEPAVVRRGLQAGYRCIREQPELVVRRNADVAKLGEHLAIRGLGVKRPFGSFAVFVELPAAIADATADMAARFSLGAHLFLVGGLRGHFFPFAGGAMTLRLAVPVGQAIDATATADALHEFFRTAANAQRLHFAPGQQSVHPVFRRLDAVH